MDSVILNLFRVDIAEKIENSAKHNKFGFMQLWKPGTIHVTWKRHSYKMTLHPRSQ